MKPPRLKMFAGPNGSGKSTIKEKIFKINPRWLGVYISPDDIEREIAETGRLDFGHFKVKTNKTRISNFLKTANQLIDNGLVNEVSKLGFSKNSISFQDISLNSYFVSAIADFLHESLIGLHISFSFETVMSHSNKIGLLKSVRKKS